jgi:small-conductance mechanosensitive channel
MALTPLQIPSVLLGNPLPAWLVAGGVFIVMGGSLLVARRVLLKRLQDVAKRTTTEVDDFAVDLLRRLRLYFILMIAVAAAARALILPPATTEAIRILTQLAILLQLGAWANRLIGYWVQHWAERRGEPLANSMTLVAFGALARVALWAVLILFALGNTFDLNITPLITGLGIGGVAIALAVQNILGDLFAALSIVLDKPFIVGDAIAVDNLSGTVEHVGLKTTRLRSVDGEQLVFSNTDLLRSRLRNYRRMVERRVVFQLSFDYAIDHAVAARIPALIKAVVEGTPRTRFERCHFVRFAEAALVYETAYWILSPEYLEYLNAHHAVNLALLDRLESEGARFALPTRTVRLAYQGERGPSDATAGA